MKTNSILRLAAVAVLLLMDAGAFGAEPDVAFRAVEPTEPPETGPFIYAPVAPVIAGAAPTGRFWLGFTLTNQSGVELRLNKVTLNFIVGPGGFSKSFDRAIRIPAGEQVYVSLTNLNEVITLTTPMPAAVQVLAYFDGNTTPKTLQRGLVPYAPATVDGRYRFPADEGDIGPEEYFATGNIHEPGNQFWGADWSVHRIKVGGGHTTIKEGGSASINEDRVGWDVPMRAMADGIVMRTSLGWIDNPRPGVRAFQRMSDYDGDLIEEVKVKRLGTTRAVTVARLADNSLQAAVWDVSNVGRTITRRVVSDPLPGESVRAVALEVIDDGKFVTSVRLDSGIHRLTVWEIQNKDDVNTIRLVRGPQFDDIAVTEVSLAVLSGGVVASATRTSSGRLRLAVFDSSVVNPFMATLTSESATSVSVVRAGDARFATAIKALDGRLKVIAWDLLGTTPGPYSLSRLGEAVDEAVSRVVATKNSGDKWVTAARTSPAGKLKLTRWFVSGGVIKSELMTTPIAVEDSALDIAIAKGKHATTASVIAGGVFQINLWGDQTDDGMTTYENSAENIGGVVNRVSLDELADADYFVGTRGADGRLKIMIWHYGDGGGNSVYVLHGDCQVKYFHFKADSVDTNVIYPGAIVRAGQVLGHMGNSGASGGAHTHIHSERLWPVPTPAELSAAIANATTESLPVAGTRPVPFSWARVMSLPAILPGGEANNFFSTANGQGSFEAESLGFRPEIQTLYVDPLYISDNRAGRKEGVPTRSGGLEGGPLSTVTAGHAKATPGTRLYIRGGSYNEKLILNRPALVKRYGFHRDAGSVVVGK